jgi:hypothetical protein
MADNIPLIYLDSVEEVSFDSLPVEWSRINLNKFSKDINLFDYQQDAIKNAIKLLHYYYESLRKYDEKEDEKLNIERKKKLFNEIRKFNMQLIDSIGINNKKNPASFNNIKEYYNIIKENSHEKIHFLNFVNRMSFWMATGSGKTLVLIKLVELLDKLMQTRLIPNNDILILTHRDDLVNQIKKHIEEFNKISARKVNVWELNRYDDVKRGIVLTFKDDINIFIYRSDLISDRTKEKLLSFSDIENNGRWYVLLDEAHKGDKEDSKRQLYYSVLTRNGFLFNFSATFTDVWDIISTVYNFNLDNFIRAGYGKNVYLSQQELNAFKDKKDFDSKDKQKIVLKALMLLTVNKKAKKNIDGKLGKTDHYHNPLLVSLVNSVNVEDSDLEIFFKQIEKIAQGDIDKETLENAKEELIQEFASHPRYVFGHDVLAINKSFISEIDIKELLKTIFNADKFGKIEVIKLPQNKEELIFKLKTSDKPFALIKIGDISKWLKEKLDHYEINESYDNTSVFKTISQDNNQINILMGSRAFYEGWDSNRPNVMIFINIGKGDAQKYITQSIGRGVRIEPIKGKRKRLIPLKRENDLNAKEMCSKLDAEDVSLIENLFVLGTNKDNVEKILESIKYERKTSGEIIELKENEASKIHTLLIPVYKEPKEILAVDIMPQFEGDRKRINDFITWLNDERLVYSLFSDENNLEPKTISRIKDVIEQGNFSKNTNGGDVYTQISRLISYVNIKLQEVDKFKKLENEIVHFKKIRVSLESKELEKLKELINKVKEYKDPTQEEKIYKELLRTGKIDIDGYTSKIKDLNKTSNEEEFKDLKIKHIVNHYYVPLILSTKEKVNYINHIVNVESERRFIEGLENHIKQEDNLFKKFDWWMFSKIDEHLDEIYIPYYNKVHNKIERFKPDFIFWLKKGDKYLIIFTDPKGTRYSDYEHKVDGYKRIFEEKDNKKIFPNDKLGVQVHLFLYTEDENKLSEGYKKYWFDSFNDIKTKISF